MGITMHLHPMPSQGRRQVSIYRSSRMWKLMSDNSREILDIFEISGRGLVMLVHALPMLVSSNGIPVVIVRQDGSSITALAYKEIIKRLSAESLVYDAFHIPGIDKNDIPIGSRISFV